MDIIRLKYFITAAERLNFTIAAKERYITQTAMSLHIKKMEDELGFKLFIRDKRSIKLTEAGLDFYYQACELVSRYEMAVRRAEGLASGACGTAGIMLPGYNEGSILLDKLRVFRTEYPDVHLTILVEPPGRHVSELKNGLCDVIIGAPSDMERDPEIVYEIIREDPIFVICNVRHHFASLPFVMESMLQSESTVLCEPRWIPEALRTLLCDQNAIVPVKNLGEVLMHIGLESRVSFLPRFAAQMLKPRLTNISAVPLIFENSAPTITTALGYLKHNTNPVLKNLVSALLRD